MGTAGALQHVDTSGLCVRVPPTARGDGALIPIAGRARSGSAHVS